MRKVHSNRDSGNGGQPARIFPLAAAVLAFGMVVLSPDAQAQTTKYANDQAELVRRVEQGEQENGYCAKTNFPRRNDIGDFFKYLDDAKDGLEFHAKSDYPNSGGCSYYRILSVDGESSKRCLKTRSWACFDKGDQNGKCAKVDRTWCKDGKLWKRTE